MLERRVQRSPWSALLAVVVGASPVVASAVDVALYPLDGEGLPRATLAKLNRLVVNGANNLAERSERFEPLEPMMVAPRCGRASRAERACLAGLAGKGVLVFGEASREGDDAVVTIGLIDGRGRVSRSAWFRVSLAVMSSGPAAQALEQLDAALGAGLRAPPPPPLDR